MPLLNTLLYHGRGEGAPSTEQLSQGSSGSNLGHPEILGTAETSMRSSSCLSQFSSGAGSHNCCDPQILISAGSLWGSPLKQVVVLSAN